MVGTFYDEVHETLEGQSADLHDRCDHGEVDLVGSRLHHQELDQVERRGLPEVQHPTARTLTALHQTELLELTQRRAQRVAIDTELRGELAFRGQQLTGLVRSGEDGGAKLASDTVERSSLATLL